MIRRYDFGTPIETGAVVKTISLSTDAVPYFAIEKRDGALSFSLSLSREEIIYGLGETVRGINKRGHLYRSWNSDEPNHAEHKSSLYASHNLLIFSGEGRLFAAFFDDPGEVVFDLGFTRHDEAVITSINGDLRLYILEEETLIALTRAFRQLIGPSYLPPKWAFGYAQSRWGYKTEEDIRRVVSGHRDNHIPLDAVCMDIDYMDDFMDFTVDSAKFADLTRLNRELGDMHAHLVPIIDAGVKEKAGYDVYEEGLHKGCFVCKEDGKPFIGAVWPGRSLFPDFLRQDVRKWFGEKYRRLLDTGIEGFWNDMNEPALFYSEEGLEAAFEKTDALKGKNLGIHDFFRLQDIWRSVANSPEDYRRFYHTVDGKRVRHDKVHNLYGAYMTRAAAEGMQAYDPGKRHLLYARSSYIGAHRYGGVWQGDNCAWWSHLLLNLKMLPSLNMCGFLYTGADLGGFGCDTTEDLVLRWLQLGVFTPLMRNHAAMGTREQEAYQFSMMEDMKNILTVRYALLPYLYSEFMKNALTDGCMFRPLAFDYPQDPMARRVEDQVMLGEGCMIAPVYEQNAQGRYVYLPEDMLLLRLRSAGDYDLVPMAKGHHYVELALHEMPLFIRKGRFIPLSRGGEWVDAVSFTELTLIGWLSGDAQYALYNDDGITAQAALEGHVTEITVCSGEAKGEGLTLDASKLILD